MKLLPQNQLRPHRFVSLVIACLQACQKLPGFYLCLIKAWSHSFARILENEIHPGSVRQISMIIHSPITVVIQGPLVVIQSDTEPIVSRWPNVGSFLVDFLVRNRIIRVLFRPKKNKEKQWETVVIVRNLRQLTWFINSWPSLELKIPWRWAIYNSRVGMWRYVARGFC